MNDKKIVEKLHSIYLFLLIFSCINKGFVPFGIDLRIVVFILSAFFLLEIVTRPFRNKKIATNPLTKWFVGLSLVILLTTVVINPITELSQSKDFKNLVILNIYNLINIIIMLEYKTSNFVKKAYRFISASVLFLFISQVAVLMGYELPFSSYVVETTASIDDGVFNIAKIFGINSRVDGYGIDPNYVSLVMVLFACLSLKYEKKRKRKIALLIIAAISTIISLSRTILLAIMPVAIVALVLYKKGKKNPNIKISAKMCYMLVAAIMILATAVASIKPFDSSSSLSIRYSLWDKASNLAAETKYIGAGLGSFREYSMNISNFYVQSHSTMFQLLSEHGLAALLLFGIIIAEIFKICDKKLFIAVMLFFVWSFTYETMYIPHLIIFTGIIPRMLTEERSVKK